MTAIPWNVLSDSHSSQRLCSGDYWPENDFLPSLQPHHQLEKLPWDTFFILSSLEALFQLYLWCPKPCTSPERSCASWSWLIVPQRSRKPQMSAEHVVFQDLLVYMSFIISVWLTCFLLPGVLLYTFHHHLDGFGVRNSLIWKMIQINQVCLIPLQWMGDLNSFLPHPFNQTSLIIRTP